MKDRLVAAFHHARQDFSPDRVVADPDLNRIFLDECHRLGLGLDAATLNRSLLNLRKRGELPGLRSRRTILKDQPDYRFAAEIAARFLERKNEISLDQIICDPLLAEQFDEIARAIAPGGRPLEYRWAALNLRKQRRLRPEVCARVVRPVEVLRVNADGVLPRVRCPGAQGCISFTRIRRRFTWVSRTIFRNAFASTSIIPIEKSWRDGSGNSVTPRFIWSFKSWTSRSRNEFEGLSSSSSFGLARRSST